MSEISLRPPKFNSFRQNKKQKINLKINKLFLDLEYEKMKLLKDIINSFNNKNIYLKLYTETTKNINYDSFLNFIYKNFKYSLSVSNKSHIEKYLNNEPYKINNNNLENIIEDDEILNLNLHKINNHIDFKLLGNTKELNNIGDNQDNDDNILSDDEFK